MGEKYRILFESSRDAIMLLAPPDWLFTIGNKATLEMFGAKNEKEFYSKTPADLSPEYQPDGQLSSKKAGKVIGKAMRNGSFFFEWTHKRINGNEFSANVLLTRIELEGNKLLTATVRDITGTKKTEKELQRYRDHLEKIVEERTTKLQKSEEKYRSFFRTSKDCIFITSKEGEWLDMSDSAHEFFGYENKEELKKVKIHDLYENPADRKKHIRQIKKQGFAKDFAVNLRKKDGTVINTFITSVPIKNKKGEVIAFQGSIQDINAQKKAKKILNRERDLLTALIDNSPDNIYFKDKKSRFIRLSKNHIEKFGIKNPEDAVGKSDFDFFSEEFAREAYEDEQEVMRTGKPLVAKEEKEVWPDGRITWAFATKLPLYDNERNIIGTCGITRDNTAKKEVDKELNRERDLITALIDNSPDNIYFKDKKSRFIRISKNHIKKFGIKDPKEAIGKTDFDFFSDEHANEAYEDEQEVMRTGKPLVAKEEKETWPDGSVTWASSTKLPLYDTERNIIGTCGITRDITEQKKAENALKESEKNLNELNASKDKFFSIIGHDLRSPFNSIIGFSEILFNETEAFSKAEIKEMAESIYKVSQETYNLLNNLLEWSGTQTGRIKFEPAKTGIYDIVISTIDLLNDNAKKKNISILVDIPEQLQVFADLNMINTVIRNLLSNAIKFTQKKGSIKISAQDTGKSVEITVADTGVGIKPENIKKLFQIDSDFSNPGTANEKGTGLGLMLCKEFIVMNNGNIRVESAIGKGSRFIISLPKKKEKEG